MNTYIHCAHSRNSFETKLSKNVTAIILDIIVYSINIYLNWLHIINLLHQFVSDNLNNLYLNIYILTILIDKYQ